jgi:hypothetical protein
VVARFISILLLLIFSRAAIASETNVLFELERKAFDFFWFEAHPKTGLIKDRAKNHGRDNYENASIAATGFGLAALPVAVEHGWVSRKEAEDRANLTLRTFAQKLTQEHGWFYHFVKWSSGERAWKCEVSSVDTAWLVCGALLAGEYFGGETQALADTIYSRLDFPWMLTDGGLQPDAQTLSMGWKPESGFIKARWNTYSEHLALGILALGSPTHPVGAETWKAWKRNVGEYSGHKTFACGPLFTHQYSQMFIDFRGSKDSLGFDYFDSAREATLADRDFCVAQSARFKTYGTNVWGLSACDNARGDYEAYGAPPGDARSDGTVSVWNTAASVVFAPDLVTAAINHMDSEFPQLRGRYGFCGAFNLDQNWFAPDVIGIDLGAALLMIENYRSEFVWREFMKIEAIRRGMERAGFTAKRLELLGETPNTARGTAALP